MSEVYLLLRWGESAMCLPKSIKCVFTLATLAGFLLGAASLVAQDTGRGGFPLPESDQGAAGSQSCFETSNDPGCNDEFCEAIVCAIDSFCCGVSWDDICVDEAIELCPTPEDGPRARFQVAKNFTDDNPSEVEVSISCNTGLPLDQSKHISAGDGVVFVVTDYDDGELDCEITEPVPGGYNVTYDAIPGDTSSVSCAFEDLPWGAFTICNITNDPAPVTVTVDKVWMFHNESGGNQDQIDDTYDINLTCNAVIQGGYPSGNNYVRHINYNHGDQTFNFTVYPTYGGNTCWADEDVYDSAVESDNSGCQGMAIDIGEGNSCTITNTVFFEGIPTLSQYGLAILALLMLGVGFVGFRRFV